MANYQVGTRLEKIIKIGDLQEGYKIVKIDRSKNAFLLIQLQSQNPDERILETQESLDTFYTIVENPRGH